MKIGIVVGELSGDKLAASLLRNILVKNKNVKLIGVAGPELENLGCKSICSMNDLSAFGLVEPFIKINKLIKIRSLLIKNFINKIDIFIGVDFSGFNLNLEKTLKNNGICTFHFVSPSVWAWRYNRINKIKNATNIMFLLYPFEKKIYEKKKIPFKWIGHPSTQKINVKLSKNLIKTKFNINKNDKIISILPGSRCNEIKQHINLYKQLACRYEIKKNILFITSVYDKKHYEIIKSLHFKNIKNVKLFFNEFYNVLIISNLIIAASGTACLESALYKKFVIVIYKLNHLVFKFLKIFIKIKHISLPNIILRKSILTEYIQTEFNIKNLSKEIEKTRNGIIINKNVYTMEKLLNCLNNDTRNSFEVFFSKFFFN